LTATFPRTAAALHAAINDPVDGPMWRLRIRAAAIAVTGKRPDDAEAAVFMLITERKARMWTPNGIVGPKLARTMNLTNTAEFWRECEEAAAAFDELHARLQIQPEPVTV
jgi:hypothetical protein